MGSLEHAKRKSGAQKAFGKKTAFFVGLFEAGKIKRIGNFGAKPSVRAAFYAEELAYSLAAVTRIFDGRGESLRSVGVCLRRYFFAE